MHLWFGFICTPQLQWRKKVRWNATGPFRLRSLWKTSVVDPIHNHLRRWPEYGFFYQLYGNQTVKKINKVTVTYDQTSQTGVTFETCTSQMAADKIQTVSTLTFHWHVTTCWIWLSQNCIMFILECSWHERSSNLISG